MSSSELSGYDSATSRSSPMRIADVVSKFGSLKRKLVADIGFQGMLKVPQIEKLDKKFSLSLLNKIDTKNRGIQINKNTFIEISPQDVHRYLDIPIGPNKLFGLEDRSPSEKMDFIRFGIGSSTFDIDEKNSLKAAEEIVRANYSNGMSESQEEQFKVSFVCFCMGHFLLAKYSSNHGIKDFWGSLMTTSEIPTYNFCQAVVDEIIECARHVQRESKANRIVKNFSGCNLFLQSWYLDSINHGTRNVPANATPRIAFFSYKILHKMINDIESEHSLAVVKDRDKNAVPKQGISAMNNVSSVSKGKETAPKTILAKPASTEYLAAYTRGAVERKLTDKQIDALRLHNARMKRFVYQFKSKTMSDIQQSGLAVPAFNDMFSTNVDNLLNEVLGQVLVLSKSLHEHSTNSEACSFISPSLYTSSKRTFDNTLCGYESSTDGSSIKRVKTSNFPYGKNLLPDLINAAGNSTPLLRTAHNIQSGQIPINDIGSSYITPNVKLAQKFAISTSTDDTPTGLEELTFSNLRHDTTPACNPSSSSSNQNKFSTPIGLPEMSDVQQPAVGDVSDATHFQELLEANDAIELNEIPVNNDLTYSIVQKICVKKGRMAKNPWFYGVARNPLDKEIADTLFNWLQVTNHNCLDSYWINHLRPKQIMVAGNDFKSVFTRGYNFTNDLLDMGIRRFGQMDRFMYGEGVNLRWLHRFETDFAMKVMNDEDPLSSHSIRLQLTATAEEYDICNCRMIAVPNISSTSWSSYFWDMKEHIVHVVDPTFDITRASEIHELHNPIVDKMQGAIESCFAAIYDGWEIDWSIWKKSYVKPFLHGKKSNESGMLTLLALRHFSGSKYEVPQTEASLRWIAKELFYDILSIEGNRGVVPDVFIQSID